MDKRRPHTTILIRNGGGPTTKLELFSGELFPGAGFHTLRGVRLKSRDRSGMVRLRVDGKWYPEGERCLLSKAELSQYLLKMAGE